MNNKLRSVNTKFWDDPFIEGLSPSKKLLFLYLLTNPLTNLLGIYEITIKRISYDTGINKESISKALEGFEKVNKVLNIDNYFILPNFLKNQSLNENMKIGVVNLFKGLPNYLKERLLGNDYQMIQNDYVSLLNGLLKLNGIEREEEREEERESSKADFNFQFLDAKFIPVFMEWVDYKKSRNENYKTQKSLEACYRNLLRLSQSNPDKAKLLIDQAMGNNWAGIFPLKSEGQITNRSEIQGSRKYLDQ
jgi:hypothetical protein